MTPAHLFLFLALGVAQWKVVLAQTAFDQTAGAVLVISGFFVFFGLVTSVADGTLTVAGVPAVLSAGAIKVRTELRPTILANWKLWPLANAANFALVPLQYRVLFTNLVAVIWNVYLSSAMLK